MYPVQGFVMNPLFIPVLSVIGVAAAIGVVVNSITGIVRKPERTQYLKTWMKFGIALGLLFTLLFAGAWGKWSFLPIALLLGYFSWQELLNAVDQKYESMNLPSLSVGCGLIAILSGLWSNPVNLFAGILLSLSGIVTLPLFILRRPFPLHNFFATTFGICFVSLPLACLLNLTDVRYGAFSFLVTVAMVNDGFSEGIGRFAGRIKLCPEISPGKTLEGSIGGLISALFVGYALRFLLPEWQTWAILLLAGGVSIFLLIGDLLFSVIKREVGIKDFGQTLAVTGGVLDKFDGLMLTIPLFFVVTQLLGG